MEFLELILNLLEKLSVLVASALVLLLLRPAEVWLGETGAQASFRRRAFLFAILGGLAIWGVFLGFDVGGTRFNLRMVGIIVAGYLGGRIVGTSVGAAAGLVYAVGLSSPMAGWAFAASLVVGGLAGLWSRKIGTGVVSVVVGALVIQLIYHAALGGVMAAIDLGQAVRLASNLELHAAKIAANTIGVSIFMGLLNLVRELELARKEARASREVVRSARLEALQYQVKPHFLFNLLNTLAYLIRTDPAAARELTLDLSEFLRYTLSQAEDVTTLREELAQITRYVDLERARFGEGLRFEVDLPDDEAALEVRVPPLILQPLVENAIRHGSRDGGVSVRVEVAREDDAVHVRVLDDGPGPRTPWHGTRRKRQPGQTGGLGLENVRERLARFYGGSNGAGVDVRLVRRDGGGACAEFTIPLSAAPRPAGLKAQAREQLRKVVE